MGKGIVKKMPSWFNLLYSFFALLMLMALFTFGYATWIDVKDQAVISLTPHNNTLTHVVERFFNHQEQILTGLANDWQANPSSSDELVIRLQDFLHATPQMKTLVLLDQQGTVIASAGELAKVAWLDLYKNNSAIIGQPFRSSFVGDDLLPLRVPVKDETGRTQGYVVAAYHIGNDTMLQTSEANQAERRSMLIDDDGQLYLALPETETLWQSFITFKASNAFMAAVSDIQNNDSASAEVRYQNEKLTVTADHLDKYHLFVISGLPFHHLYTTWLDRMKLVALSVLVFLAVGLFVFRRVFNRASKVEVERHKAESNVNKLLQAIEQSPSSVVVTNAHWMIEYANSRLGVTHDDLLRIEIGRCLSDVFPHTILTNDLTTITENLKYGDSWYGERRTRNKKQWFSFSVSSMTDDEGQTINYVIITQDITERKKAEEKLFRQANYDALTGLPNRRRANQLLAESTARASKQANSIAVFYMDMDNFKQVNDTFGHLLGDQLLKYMAALLQNVVGDQGYACHMSGDEFLVFMEYNQKSTVITMAESILDAMSQPVMLEGKKLFTSVSIGISCFPEDSTEPDTVLKQADIALYEAKNRGRSCFNFFDHEIDKRNRRIVELQAELRTALTRQELFMTYQTKNHIDTQQIYGFEALMRWNSPKFGLVSPEEFIEIAEDIGIIDQLGEFALLQACTDFIRFQAHTDQPLAMAVNVSVLQLTKSDIVTTVSYVLDQTGMPPNKLELEITESLLAQSMEELQPILQSLLELGVTLSIDDFGTGYSSLSYLTRFPVSTLKIDRCFVTNIVSNQNDATLARMVVGMAHKLGLKVVAEGIEDAEQLALLNSYDCDLGQGYLFTKPLPFSDMLQHVQDQAL